MGRFATGSTTLVLDSVLASQPEVLSHLHDAWDQAWLATDPYVLELCRLRIAMLLHCEAESQARTPAAESAGLSEATIEALAAWTFDEQFRPVDRACLAFTEQFVIDVANLDNVTASNVVDHLGEVGMQDFLSALLVLEQRIRLRLAWDCLFGDAESATLEGATT
jgi:alkylhydroperoxidase family enzyme